MSAKNPMLEHVFELIEQHGPITTVALAKIEGKTPGALNAQISLLREAKRVHAADRCAAPRGRHPLAWMVGSEPAAKQPDEPKGVAHPQQEAVRPAQVQVQPRTIEEIEDEADAAIDARNRKRKLAQISVWRHPYDTMFYGAYRRQAGATL